MHCPLFVIKTRLLLLHFLKTWMKLLFLHTFPHVSPEYISVARNCAETTTCLAFVLIRYAQVRSFERGDEIRIAIRYLDTVSFNTSLKHQRSLVWDGRKFTTCPPLRFYLVTAFGINGIVIVVIFEYVCSGIMHCHCISNGA